MPTAPLTLPDLQTLARQTEDICRQTGEYLRTEREGFSLSRVEQKGLNDLVSYVDREAEHRLITALGALLPGSGFVAEEGTVFKTDGRTDPGPGTWWVIDPLDGTTNFIHGLGIYAVSVGLLHEGRLVVGVIYDPVRRELFSAWAGGGAYLNGQPIRVSPARGLGQSLLATGFPYQRFEKQAQYLAALDELMRQCHGLRRMGSAAIDLAYVAAGRFEGFFEYNLKAWDAAAGILLVQEAGGHVADFAGSPRYLFDGELIAAAPGVWEEFYGVVEGAFAR